MKMIIFILFLFVGILQAQDSLKIKKDIPTVNISGSGVINKCKIIKIINDGTQDVYLVDLGVMELNEESGKVEFKVVYSNSYFIVADAPYQLTKKELDKVKGISLEIIE